MDYTTKDNADLNVKFGDKMLSEMRIEKDKMVSKIKDAVNEFLDRNPNVLIDIDVSTHSAEIDGIKIPLKTDVKTKVTLI